MKLVPRYNLARIMLIISIVGFGISLVLTYYDQSIGNYLLIITYFSMFIVFFSTATSLKKAIEKKEDIKPILRFNFVGVMVILSLFLFGLSLAVTYYHQSIGFYLANVILFLISLTFLIIAIKQAKEKK
jgi:hypothetical protein